jgi:hypothetical protein
VSQRGACRPAASRPTRDPTLLHAFPFDVSRRSATASTHPASTANTANTASTAIVAPWALALARLLRCSPLSVALRYIPARPS